MSPLCLRNPGKRALHAVSALAALVAALGLVVAAPGCARLAYTRVFLHGEVEDEDGKPVPFAVVRLSEFETVSDEKGHYRALYVARCLRATMGIQGVQSPEVEVFATGYADYRLAFHLDTIELVGGGSCPADSDKYLRLILARPRIPGS